MKRIKPSAVKKGKSKARKILRRTSLLSLILLSASCYSRRLMGTRVPPNSYPIEDGDEGLYLPTPGEVEPLEDLPVIDDFPQENEE